MALIFKAPVVPSLGIAGSNDRVPVNRVFCVGRNYAAHAAEMGAEVERDAPFYFTKGHHAVHTDSQEAAFPPGTQSYHHEIELVVVIGRGGHTIPQAHAMDHVYGYASGLDMTRRDLQQANRKKGLPWDTGKDVEQAAILSAVTPSDAFGPISNQRISLTKNGEPVQASTLDLMVWSVPELIAHLSTLYHLRPGDLIMTGTPEGVGPVERGDRLTGGVEGCPALDVTFV